MTYQNSFVHQPAVDHPRDQADRRRTLLAALVVCVGVGVAALALWQARVTRTVYVPVPMESVGTAPPLAQWTASDATTEAQTVHAPPTVPVPQRVVVAPTLPMTQAAPLPTAMATPVDYAARDRQIADLKRRIEEIDETIRRVRADPHWYGIVKGSTETSRQQSSDVYLEQLDKQRNDLRRQKWALEGR